LTAAEIARIARALGEGIVGLDAIPLVGGLDTATYRLDVRLPDGTTTCLVLHQYRGWEPARASARVNGEQRLLAAIGPVFRWAPRTLLSDPSGELLGDPATVLTYLPGAPTPPPQVAIGLVRETWIDEFARPLASLHGIALDRLPSDCRVDDPDGGLDGIARQARDDELSRALLAALRRTGPPRDASRSLLHHDYWYGNTLWSDGRLTGVIDWTSARMGDPQKDVALARCDLAVTLDLRASNEFVDRYRGLGGATGAFAYWDLLWALMGYRWIEEWLAGYAELGLPDLPLAEARARIIAFAESALRAAPGS
jgi:aminoglycoside phosphotransferase (APT) family kinase protein